MPLPHPVVALLDAQKDRVAQRHAHHRVPRERQRPSGAHGAGRAHGGTGAGAALEAHDALGHAAHGEGRARAARQRLKGKNEWEP